MTPHRPADAHLLGESGITEIPEPGHSTVNRLQSAGANRSIGCLNQNFTVQVQVRSGFAGACFGRPVEAMHFAD